MRLVLIDTHVLIWYLVSPHLLSATALEIIRGVVNDGYPILISSMSVVEICYLTEKQKIPPLVLERVQAALNNSNSGMKILPVSHEIALEMQKIPRETVPEMCDRIIAATALYLGLPLVTKDHKIRNLDVIQTIWDSPNPESP